jgi:hypothetical protein
MNYIPRRPSPSAGRHRQPDPNFGLPAPLDVRSRFSNANRAYANDLLARMHKIPGIADLRIQQAMTTRH